MTLKTQVHTATATATVTATAIMMIRGFYLLGYSALVGILTATLRIVLKADV